MLLIRATFRSIETFASRCIGPQCLIACKIRDKSTMSFVAFPITGSPDHPISHPRISRKSSARLFQILHFQPDLR
jgi:anaerobic selenocysteine-containing dehydrogenase